MSTTADTQKIVNSVIDRLRTAEQQDRIYLKVSDSKVDDDWLYVAVVPSRPGVRAIEHAELLSKIERELIADGHDKVLLVPALED